MKSFLKITLACIVGAVGAAVLLALYIKKNGNPFA